MTNMSLSGSLCLALALFFYMTRCSSSIIADVEAHGPTVSPEYHRPSGQPAALCPMTHPYPHAERTLCCSNSEQSNAPSCVADAALLPDSPEECCKGITVPCPGQACRKNPASTIYGDCSDIGQPASEGIYTLVYDPVDNSKQVDAYCTAEGWTVIQSRGQFGYPQDYFYKTWAEYKAGFGAPGEEHWLGLDHIYGITNNSMGRVYALRIDMQKVDGTTAYAYYDSFLISNEPTDFTLSLGIYQGTAGDSLTQSHNGYPFSTKDNDNDSQVTDSCANKYKGGWWYHSCHASNLNGLNLVGYHSTFADGINWKSFTNYNNSLLTVTMAIKPV